MERRAERQEEMDTSGSVARKVAGEGTVRERVTRYLLDEMKRVTTMGRNRGVTVIGIDAPMFTTPISPTSFPFPYYFGFRIFALSHEYVNLSKQPRVSGTRRCATE